MFYMATNDVNPRLKNYARVHGRTVEEQMIVDRQRWPGGHMIGFTFWNNERIAEFAKINPDAVGSLHGRPALLDHRAYDRWLDSLPVLPAEVRNITPSLAEPEMRVYDEVY